MYSMVVIDEEKWVVRSLMSLLQPQKHFELCGEAYDGPSGLRLLQSDPPDLALVATHLPGFSGLELVKTAAEHEWPTLFILLSRHADFRLVQQAMLCGVVGYCLKPFNLAELNDHMARVAHLLRRRHSTADTLASALPVQKEIQTKKEPSFSTTTANPMVKSMLAFLHANYKENISVSDMAHLCTINQSYAGQLFRQEMSETISNYLARIRMEKAVALLKDSNMTISTIAVEVGYRDYFYFAKVFKKMFGMTPGQYRAAPASKHLI